MTPSLEKSKIVQTFAEDMAQVLKDDKSGLVKKIIHGEEEREKEKMELSPESKKNKFFMFLSFLFILAAFSTIIFFTLNREVSTVPVEEQFVPLIFNDKSSYFEVKDFQKEEVEQTVLNEVGKTEVKTGGVEGIYLTKDKKVVGLRGFLAFIKSSLVLNNFVDDNFLLGVVNDDSSKDFFILLKVRELPDVFDTLRSWEGKIFLDLHGFFGIQVSSETKYLLTKDFEDGIIQNKNARILYDKDGKIVMMYIFADDNSIIITNTESAAREVMLRLASSKVKK